MGTKKKPIFLFGAGGHAKVVIDILERQGTFLIKYLVDDNPSLEGNTVCGYPVIGGRDKIQPSRTEMGIVAVGDNGLRCAVSDWLKSRSYGLITAIHPSAQIARGVVVGNGTVVMAGAIINSDAVIGENVIVNTRAGIDHDCVIRNGVHIAPNATLCGAVRVDEMAFIGAGATIIPNLSVGREVVVGAGATVVDDVPPRIVVVGLPAKKLL